MEREKNADRSVRCSRWPEAVTTKLYEARLMSFQPGDRRVVTTTRYGETLYEPSADYRVPRSNMRFCSIIIYLSNFFHLFVVFYASSMRREP